MTGRDPLWAVEGELAFLLEGFAMAKTAEAMENLGRRFQALATDSQLRSEKCEVGSIAHHEHQAERSVYLEAKAMAAAEASHLWKEANIRGVTVKG